MAACNVVTAGIQEMLDSLEKNEEKSKQDEASSQSASDSDHNEEHAVALLMVAEIQEKLCAAMHHYNQQRRLDTKIVARYAYQLYRLITCIAWIIVPTVATALVSFVTDIILANDKDLQMYKNLGLVVANTILWMIGVYNLVYIWKDLKQCSNDLQCLSEKRWMYEEEFVNGMLCRGMMPEGDVIENEGIAKEVGVENIQREAENVAKAATIEEIESGAAGDVPKSLAKDKDV